MFNINRSAGTGGAGGAIAPPIFASSSTLAPPIFAGSSTSWGCYSSPNFFDLPAGLRYTLCYLVTFCYLELLT